MVIRYSGQDVELLRVFEAYNKCSIKFYNLRNEHHQCVAFSNFEKFLNNLYQLTKDRDPEWLAKEKRNFLNEFHKLELLAKKLKNLKIKLNPKTVAIINSLSEYNPIRYHAAQFAIGFGKSILSPVMFTWGIVSNVRKSGIPKTIKEIPETVKGIYVGVRNFGKDPGGVIKGVANSVLKEPGCTLGTLAGSIALGALTGSFIGGIKSPSAGLSGSSMVATFPHPSGVALGKVGSKISIASNSIAVVDKISTVANTTSLSNAYFGSAVATAVELTEKDPKESKQDTNFSKSDDDLLELIKMLEPEDSRSEELQDFVDLMTALKPKI